MRISCTRGLAGGPGRDGAVADEGPGGARSTGAAVRGSFTLFEESVDSLRTGLTLSSDMRDVRVLAVTSAVQERRQDERGRSIGDQPGPRHR